MYYNCRQSFPPTQYPQNADVAYTYDGGSSQKLTMVDSSGTSSYGYDIQGRLITYTPPQPSGHAAVSYGYNNLGQKTGISTTGYSVTYDYFANGWLKEVKKSGNPVSSYEYDFTGNRTRVDFGNSTWQTFDYDTDPRYRLEEIRYGYRCDEQASVTDNGGLTLTRDGSGNPLTWGDSADTYGRVYTYDQNSRLDSANYPGSGLDDFTYDWTGNRINPGSFTYNAADQLLTANGHTYGYDDNGNLTTVDSSPRYTYTYANLLSTVAGGTSMTWDAAGNRITFTSSTDQSNPYVFVYDPTAGIPAIIEEVHDDSAIYYAREPNGALICRIDGETTQYYHFDELGSTLFLTGSAGTVTDEYTYDAWGNVASHEGSTQQPYQYVGRLGYYTHYQDGNMEGLLQLGVRFYDPEVGRFTQRDPIKDGLNWYAYVEGRPTGHRDPSGLTCLDCENKFHKCREDAISRALDITRSAIGRGIGEMAITCVVGCVIGGAVAHFVSLGTTAGGCVIGCLGLVCIREAYTAARTEVQSKSV